MGVPLQGLLSDVTRARGGRSRRARPEFPGCALPCLCPWRAVVLGRWLLSCALGPSFGKVRVFLFRTEGMGEESQLSPEAAEARGCGGGSQSPTAALVPQSQLPVAPRPWDPATLPWCFPMLLRPSLSAGHTPTQCAPTATSGPACRGPSPLLQAPSIAGQQVSCPSFWRVCKLPRICPASSAPACWFQWVIVWGQYRRLGPSPPVATQNQGPPVALRRVSLRRCISS